MFLKTDSYTGNGTSKTIEVGFAPQFVLVKIQNDTLTYQSHFKTASMAGASTTSPYAGAIYDGITLTANGFSVNDLAGLNADGENFYYMAARDNGEADFAYGTYDGNSTDDRDITGLGFQPDIVVVKSNTGTLTYSGSWRTDRQSGDATLKFGENASAQTNQIKALLSDGFRLGTATAVNESGKTYYWFAFKKSAGKVETGTYTGTGQHRWITVGWKPKVVWVKGLIAKGAVWRSAHEPADKCLKFMDQIRAVDAIEDFDSTGFYLGAADSVNNSGGETYAWAVFGGVLPQGSGQPCWCGGADPYLTGGQPGFVQGIGPLTSAQPAYCAGAIATLGGAQPASAHGWEVGGGQQPVCGVGYDPTAYAAEASLHAWLKGGGELGAFQPAWLEGTLPPHVEGGLPAFTCGVGSLAAGRPAFVRGREAHSAGLSSWLAGADYAALTAGLGAFVVSLSTEPLSATQAAHLVGGLPPGCVGFSAAGAQLAFSVGRTYPLRQPRERLQVVSRSAGGSLRVADKGCSLRLIRLAFRGLSAADYAALTDWFEQVAVGALNTFTFIDEESATHSVRWIGGLSFEQTHHGRYSGEITLERVG